jgi:GMP synthase-like glutamine amidotransferase
VRLKLGVLEAGAPPVALQPRFGSYGGMFRTLLGEHWDWRAYDLQRGEWPDAPEEQDGFIVSGSAAGVYEDDPWIGRLLEFLRGALGRTKLVGVCFGHQAMAQAFGGRVIKSPHGWGIGLQRYEVVVRAPWMDEAASFAVPASHQDQVVELPPGARVRAASSFTPFALLDYPGQDAISIQPHPEFDPAYAKALIESRRGTRYPDAQADAAIASLDGPNDRARVAGWIARFLQG